ncbi:MAG TPA: acyltransferase family protein, partial [Acidobacteriaceae bacterium]|nr:acyltransferase family protein [Acidobacteriaceae bacterium]
MSTREHYIDHLRTVMTVMVIFAHSAITYGGGGDWFYVEVHQPAARTSLLLTLFVATCSVSMMGCFFLLAGYFSPGSLERKGYGRYLQDRLLRLGLPLLLFGAVVAPLTIGLSAHAVGHSFRLALFWTLSELFHLRGFYTGPMWFAEDLLIFSMGYCAAHALWFRGKASRERVASPLPTQWLWVVCAVVVGAVALMIRQVFPIDMRVGGTWPAALALYLFLFVVGILAWRRDWLKQLEWRKVWPAVVIACLAWPAMPVGTVIFAAKGLSTASVRGMGVSNVLLA